MQTPDFIDRLAADVGPLRRGALDRRIALGALVGGAASLVMVVIWLGPRPDLSHAASGGFFWIKAGYTAALAMAGFLATRRLAQPQLLARAPTIAGALLFIGFAIVAIVQFMPMDGPSQMAALRGVSWKVCSRNIVVLAVPMTAICLVILRGLAPTRAFAAGFAAGIFSGALAATIYGLHCPEATFVFVALWYSLGVLAMGLLGGVAGTFALRW